MDDKGRSRYYIRPVQGGRRHCHQCNHSHNGNMASVVDMGGGNFTFKCSSTKNTEGKVTKFYIDPSIYLSENDAFDFSDPCDIFELDQLPEVKPVTPAGEDGGKKYLKTLVGIEKKAIVVKAPMSAGKTHRTIEFIRALEGKPSVLWVTPRKAMAISLKGRFPEFGLYTEVMDADWQIIEYESMHKLGRVYDIIILDEIRSLIKSFVCATTNREHLNEHVKFMVDLCRASRHTLLLDADIKIDGAVKTFCDHTFQQDEIHYIEHTGGSLNHTIKCVNKFDFLELLYSDLSKGRKIVLCCGSSEMLKGIALEASKVVGADKAGAYYADSDIQDQLIDVNTHWEDLKFIGYTSCVTCSVSYEGSVDRVYMIPNSRTFSPREGCQMQGRPRNITTGEIIVQFDEGDVSPLNIDYVTMYSHHLSEMEVKRKYMNISRTTGEKKYMMGIRRKPTIGGLIFKPNVLTKLGIWDNIEESVKISFWYEEYLRIVKSKGFKWRLDTFREIEEGEQSDLFEATKASANMLQELVHIQLSMTDACNITDREWGEIMGRVVKGTQDSRDRNIMTKYEAQKYFKEPLTGEEVIYFKRHKRAIVNQLILLGVHSVFRGKIYLNDNEMNISNVSESPDFEKDDAHVLPILEEILGKLGIKKVLDTSTPLDLEMDPEGVDTLLEKLDKVSSTKIRAKTPLKRVEKYLITYLGIEVLRVREWIKGTRGKKAMYYLSHMHTKFSTRKKVSEHDKLKKDVKAIVRMEDMNGSHSDWWVKDTVIGTHQWVKNKCFKFDKFKGNDLGVTYKACRARVLVPQFCNKYYNHEKMMKRLYDRTHTIKAPRFAAAERGIQAWEADSVQRSFDATWDAMPEDVWGKEIVEEDPDVINPFSKYGFVDEKAIDPDIFARFAYKGKQSAKRAKTPKASKKPIVRKPKEAAPKAPFESTIGAFWGEGE